MGLITDFLAKLALGFLNVYLQRRDMRSAVLAEVTKEMDKLAIKAYRYTAIAATDPAAAAELRVRDREGRLKL